MDENLGYETAMTQMTRQSGREDTRFFTAKPIAFIASSRLIETLDMNRNGAKDATKQDEYLGVMAVKKEEKLS